jgi:hypothetical protein
MEPFPTSVGMPLASIEQQLRGHGSGRILTSPARKRGVTEQASIPRRGSGAILMRCA